MRTIILTCLLLAIGCGRQPNKPNVTTDKNPRYVPEGLVAFTSTNAPHPMKIDFPSIGRSVWIVGQLGVPIGEVVTVSGTKLVTHCGSRGDYHWLEVAQVNGNIVSARMEVVMSGWKDISNGTTVIMTGYEEGRIGHVVADLNASPNEPPFFPYQEIKSRFFSVGISNLMNSGPISE